MLSDVAAKALNRRGCSLHGTLDKRADLPSDSYSLFLPYPPLFPFFCFDSESNLSSSLSASQPAGQAPQATRINPSSP